MTSKVPGFREDKGEEKSSLNVRVAPRTGSIGRSIHDMWAFETSQGHLQVAVFETVVMQILAANQCIVFDKVINVLGYQGRWGQ